MDFTYKIMFGVGVLYTIVSFFISGISGAFHFGIDHSGHFGGHGDTGGHSGDAFNHNAHTGNHTGGISETFFSWFSIVINPLVAVSFLTIFGGIGILGTDYFKWNSLQILIIALISSITTAFLLYKYIAIPLYKAENSTDVPRDNLVGKNAEVISSIIEDGFGEIRYEVNSIRYTAPAKHIENKALSQGKKVVICKIENNIYFVAEIDGF